MTQDFLKKQNYRSFVNGYPEFCVAGFLRLERCPSKQVTVVMIDCSSVGAKDRLDPYDEALDLVMKKYKLTTAEKQDYSESVRKMYAKGYLFLRNGFPRRP